MNKIILFGAGRYLEDRISSVINLPDTDILYILDNSINVDSDFHGMPVRHPTDRIDDKYDYIVITATYAEEIKNQLRLLHVEQEKILRLKEYIGCLYNGKWKHYLVENNRDATLTQYDNKSIAVIDWTGEFNGACLAAIYMLKELKNVGYRVGFASPCAKQEFIEYVVSLGIDVCVYPNIEFTKYEDFAWIQQYETIFVNTLLPHKCIKNLNYNRIVWWIHESESAYLNEERMWGAFDLDDYKCVNIYCVSDVAINTFHRHLPGISVKRMEYGVPDFYKENPITCKVNREKIVFVILGNGYSGKGQDVLAEAITKLSDDVLGRCEFWLIGELSDKEFCKELKEKTKGYPVRYFGKLTHQKIINMYSDFDVVISASREDSLPISITEALMNKKIAVISDVIGTVAYVDNNKNAFVFENENSYELAEIIGEIVYRFEELDDMREAGRRIYDKFFSMDSYRKRLLKMVEEIDS